MPADNFKDLLRTDKKKSKIVIDTSGSIYIENYGSLSKYTTEEIALKNARQEIEICGEDLYLESIERECAKICGKIKTLTLRELLK